MSEMPGLRRNGNRSLSKAATFDVIIAWANEAAEYVNWLDRRCRSLEKRCEELEKMQEATNE